jgi:2-hydroxychromene-2-carboxylate isomerase
MATSEKPVALYFDFISPYSWLALSQLEAFAERHDVEWELRPVVYAALLDAHGLIGPAETEAKRRYTFHDVARCAEELGLELTGPPEHPFRSIEALRTACLFSDDPRGAALVVDLAHACWRDGRPLTDLAVLAEIVASVGLDAGALAERITRPEIKDLLRGNTEHAIESGVFGVPTFEYEGARFWGHDRMHHLAARVEGQRPTQDAVRRAEEMLSRPRGADRRGAPGR